jgi:hypothetical protein
MDSHPLKTLLQLQLSSDGNAVLHLPYILSSLTQEAFAPSSHLQKWTTRINSLIHSKDGGARWAGLCIAHRTSILSKPVMLECAQSWVTASLSLIAVGTHPYLRTQYIWLPCPEYCDRKTRVYLYLRRAFAFYDVFSHLRLACLSFSGK